MLSDAITKLKSEMDNSKNNSYVQVVGQLLLSHLNKNPQDAEKILAEDKTIAKSLDDMRKEAQKKKVGNVAVLSDAEGFAVVLKFFGIDGSSVVATSVPTVSNLEHSASQSKDERANDFDVKLDDFL